MKSVIDLFEDNAFMTIIIDNEPFKLARSGLLKQTIITPDDPLYLILGSKPTNHMIRACGSWFSIIPFLEGFGYQAQTHDYLNNENIFIRIAAIRAY